MQVEAERKKRAAILESEGHRDAAVNIAEGEKKSRILASEASMQEKINEARGVASAVEMQGEARQRAIEFVSAALNKEGGHHAAGLVVAEQYVQAFSNLANKSNTLIVPANANDVNSMVTQALTVYKQVTDAGDKTRNGDNKQK
jgi:regulator of protease activity HflC (stomatin/prohibitin superfamily)